MAHRLSDGIGYLPRRPGTAPVALWFHAVSVGELSASRPVLEVLRQRHPDWWIVLTVTQRHAYRLAIQEPTKADAVGSLPFDLRTCVNRALDRVRPDVLVLVECELWPMLIRRAAARAVRVLMMNARIYERDFHRYLWACRLFGRVLQSIAFIGAQSEGDRDRFQRLGAPGERVVVSANTKFDVPPPARWQERLASLRRRLRLGAGPVLVLASTHENEEELILSRAVGLRREFPGLAFVIAPRDITRARGVERLAASLGLRTARWTRLPDEPWGTADTTDRLDAVVLDTVGELPIVLGAADLVFVGGSLVDRGGHNPIEGACLGKAILMGPSTSNFADIVAAFVQERAALVVQSPDELIARVRELLADPILRAELARRAEAVVARNVGAADAFVSVIERFVAEPAPPLSRVAAPA